MKTVGLVAASALLLSSASMALAQAPTTAQNAANAQAPATQQGSEGMGGGGGGTQHGVPLRKHIAMDLQKAGFSDVKVMPDSFLVRAKDQAGQYVTMLINPNSLTEVVAEGRGSNSNTSGQQASNDTQGTSNESGSDGSPFVKVSQHEPLSSKIIGLAVHDGSNGAQLGTIKDIAYSGSHVQAYILGVNSGSGKGVNYVAVKPADLHVTWDGSAKKWRADMTTTDAQLKSAPSVQYAQAD